MKKLSSPIDMQNMFFWRLYCLAVNCFAQNTNVPIR